MDLESRSRVFAALGDPHRLAIVDALALGDLTAHEVAAAASMPMNLASHHLGILERVGLIERRVSTGDRRRRYVVLRPDAFRELVPPPVSVERTGVVLFVCTHNSARSQFAAGMWASRTGGRAMSAGSDPSAQVDPLAIRAGLPLGVDLTGAATRGYAYVDERPTLVVSVCDRARESGIPFDAPSLHWSIPDPVADGHLPAFASAFGEITQRIDRLASPPDATSAPERRT